MQIIERNIEAYGQRYDLALLHYPSDVYRVQIQIGRYFTGNWIPHSILTNPFPHTKADREESDTILLRPQFAQLATKLGIVLYEHTIPSPKSDDCDIVAKLAPYFVHQAAAYLLTRLSDPYDPHR